MNKIILINIGKLSKHLLNFLYCKKPLLTLLLSKNHLNYLFFIKMDLKLN